MKPANELLGEFIDDPRAQRDAVHIAVMPCIAGESLEPGEHVGVSDGAAVSDAKHVGIVDPFLGEGVTRGQRFWLFMYPNTITSLRHEWTHPSFPIEGVPLVPPSEKDQSERWLRAFAEANDLGYAMMMEIAQDGGQYVAQGYDLHVSLDDEFWHHVEVVSGRTFDKGHREETYFSCSC